MSPRKVRRYVDAKQEYEAFKAQRAQYPELEHSGKWLRDYGEAKAIYYTVLNTMTGGELALARRRIEVDALLDERKDGWDQ